MAVGFALSFALVDCFRGRHNRDKHCHSVVLSMSMLKESDVSSTSELCSDVFGDLLDSIIIDVASESHHIVRLGLDRKLDLEEEELRLSAEARARASDPSHSGEANGKYLVDIFGQTHPPIANEIFDCMNCGRSIMAHTWRSAWARVGRLVSRQQEVPQLHRTGTHEEALFPLSQQTRIPTVCQMEVLEPPGMNTQTAHWMSHDVRTSRRNQPLDSPKAHKEREQSTRHRYYWFWFTYAKFVL